MKLVLEGIDEFLSQFDSPETRRAYVRDVNIFFEIMKKPAKEINKINLISYVNILKERKLSSGSINRIFSSIKSYFKFLYSMELIDRSPDQLFGNLNLPSVQRKLEDDLTDTEVINMLNKTDNRRDKLIMLLMLYQGLRRSEICNMKFGDIEKKTLDNGVVHALTIIGKGNKVRTLPLAQECWKAIAEYLREDGRTGAQKASQKVLRTFRGGSDLSGMDIYNVVLKCARAAGITRRIHPHMLRAKFASKAIESGVPITTVQQALGHSSIETTSIYDHGKRSLDRLGKIKIILRGKEPSSNSEKIILESKESNSNNERTISKGKENSNVSKESSIQENVKKGKKAEIGGTNASINKNGNESKEKKAIKVRKVRKGK